MKNIFSGIKEISAGIIQALVLSFLLCIYAPIELFIANQSDFWFRVDDLWTPAVMLFGISFVLLTAIFAVLRKIGKIPYNIGIAVAFIALVISYVQGNFLVSRLPSLEGANVDWERLSFGKLASLALVVVVATAVVLLYWFLKAVKFEKVIKYVTIALGVMLTITFSTLCLTTNFVNKDKNILVTGYNDFTYSKDKNLIVFVVDAIDNNEFLRSLERNPEFSETFNDFTYFDDALAGYVYTKPSMPFIVSGKWYENDTSYEDYTLAALSESPLIKKLKEDDYKSGFYSQGSFDMPDQFSDTFENYIDASPKFKDLPSAFAMLLKMSAIRYAPWELKRFGYDAYNFSTKIMTTTSSDEYVRLKMNNINFYEEIKEKNPIKISDEKCARIIHIDGAHIPFQYNKNVELDPDATYSTNMDACLTICNAYIERLKESGVYDNSVVVIMGDHGFDITERTFIARINPAFLVKGIGEKGDKMKLSRTPVSYENVADALTHLLDGEKAENVFSKYEHKDGRRFLLFEYGKEDYMEEYRIKCRADDFGNMKPTGKVYKREK